VNVLKWLALLIVIGLVWVGSYFFYDDVYGFLSRFPWFLNTVSWITEHVMAGDYIGLIIYTVVCKSPFLPLPLEPYFLYCIIKGMSYHSLFFYSTLGLVLGSVVNYVLGFLFASLLKHRGMVGGHLVYLLVLLSSAIPLFPDILGMLFGAYRVKFRWFLIFTSLGSLVRMYLFVWAMQHASQYFINVSNIPFL